MADRSRRSLRIGQRHVLATSLFVSAVIHALVLMVPLELDQPRRRRRHAVPAARAPASSPLEVVDISGPDTRRAPARLSPIRPSFVEDAVVLESPEPSTAVGNAVVPPGEPAAAMERGASETPAAKLFRPPPPDPRLWGGIHATPAIPGPGTLGEAIAAYNRRLSGVHIPTRRRHGGLDVSGRWGQPMGLLARGDPHGHPRHASVCGRLRRGELRVRRPAGLQRSLSVPAEAASGDRRAGPAWGDPRPGQGDPREARCPS